MISFEQPGPVLQIWGGGPGGGEIIVKKSKELFLHFSMKTYVVLSPQLQIRGGIEDNSKTIFLFSQ